MYGKRFLHSQNTMGTSSPMAYSKGYFVYKHHGPPRPTSYGKDLSIHKTPWVIKKPMIHGAQNSRLFTSKLEGKIDKLPLISTTPAPAPPPPPQKKFFWAPLIKSTISRQPWTPNLFHRTFHFFTGLFVSWLSKVQAAYKDYLWDISGLTVTCATIMAEAADQTYSPTQPQHTTLGQQMLALTQKRWVPWRGSHWSTSFALKGSH